MEAVLDLRTVVFCTVVTYAICALVVLGLWQENRARFQGVGYWAADLSLRTLGFILFLLRGFVPDFISISGAHMCLLCGSFLGYVGLEKFFNVRMQRAHIVAILCIYLFFSLYFTYVTPNLWLRSLGLTLALLVISVQALWLLLFKTSPEAKILAHWLTFVTAAYTLTFLLRSLMHITNPFQETFYFDTAQVDILWFAMLQMLSILLTYAIALMLNKYLHVQVQMRDKQFLEAFHFAPYAIFMCRHADGEIHAVNNAFFTLFGFESDKVLGKTTLQLGIWANSDDRRSLVDDLQESGVALEREIIFKKENGEKFTGLLSGVLLDINDQPSIMCSINDITERKRSMQEREQLLEEQHKALSQIKILSGMIPICSSCKKIRDDSGFWNQIEAYIHTHSEAEFNHSLCPECAQKLYPDYLEEEMD